MNATSPVTISIPANILQRLDQAAQQAGMSRSQYIVSWLPEAHTPTTPTGTETSNNKTARYRR